MAKVSKAHREEQPVQIGIAVKTKQKRSNMMAVFRCHCGTTFLCFVQSVLTGNTRSCGCVRRQVTGERRRTHGKSKSKIYHVWHNMMRRCHDSENRRFSDWGGRGILVHSRWHSFEAFFEDVGDVPFDKAQIGRIDNGFGYCPGNVRWVTATENNRNTRRTRMVDLNGQLMAVSAAAEKLGITRHVLRHKLNRGDEDLILIGITDVKNR